MVARRPVLSALTATALWLIVWLYTARNAIPPAPATHDEFSYLLAAGTFARGRLANPPHPLGRFFESPHILIAPAYASKYPPGQALWLALGTRLFGSPFAGVVLQAAAAIFALGLMLQAWVSPRAAAAGIALAGWCLLPWHVPWTVSYWGGLAALIGAALVLLGLGLYVWHGNSGTAGVMVATGILQLFLTRPYEGGALCLGAFTAIAWLSRKGVRRGSIVRLGAVALPILAAGAAWVGSYNRAVTGDPLLFPYVLHDRTYNVAPVLWLLPPKAEPSYGNLRLAEQHGAAGWEIVCYRDAMAGRFGPAPRAVLSQLHVFTRLLLPVFPILLLLPLAWRDTRVRAISLACAVAVAALCLEVWHLPHYAAPAMAALLLLAACVLEAAGKRRIGRVPVRTATAAACVAAAAAQFWSAPPPPRASRPGGFAEQRAGLVRDLSQSGGRHLVVVQYADPKSCVEEEWVYNGADIDGQTVVFAHDRGETENRALFDYYRERTAWRLRAECGRHGLERVPGAVR